MVAISAPASEHAEQAAVVNFAERLKGAYPELALLFAVPNGAALTWQEDRRGKRFSPQAAKLKAEGLKPGVPDLILPVSRHGYHCLFIEMKTDKGRVSKEQSAWLEALEGQGHCARVCYGAGEAIGVIRWYLGI